MNKQKILLLISTLVIIIGIVSYSYYQNIFGELVTKDGAIYIGSNETINEVEKKLFNFIGNNNNFNWLTQQKRYLNPKSGKYLLTKGMSLNDVINLLRSGNQTPVKVSFNNQDTLEKFAGRISTQIEADSITILKTFKDSFFLKRNKLTESSVLGVLIPNTYEFYWNTSAEKFRNGLLREYTKFWNKDRLAKANAVNLTPEEVMILASIVQKETAKIIERSTVAGLYLNRIKRGIPLQADPTIIYILKQDHGEDFQVRRVLYKDLKISSPFNTYIFRGLPPSLISMPDISSIDAVLNYKKHNYVYMCASIKKIGFHEFASTLKQHNKNAVNYQRWLNNQGVNR
tara:strand:- start:8835 stop:9863 length:1029 start_codon:yes stop_codon:yes gene_type:complete